ncbi:MAG TPA: hypothetical protein VF657_20890 [Actinoplanes sp.]|jgi:hypothetical protein
MRCGNDPRAVLTDGDRAVIDWYAAWLTWSKAPADTRGPEPVPPAGWTPAELAHRAKQASDVAGQAADQKPIPTAPIGRVSRQ